MSILKLKELVNEINNELKTLEGVKCEFNDATTQVFNIIRPMLAKLSDEFIFTGGNIDFYHRDYEIVRYRWDFKQDMRKRKSCYGTINKIEYFIIDPLLEDMTARQLKAFIPLKIYLDRNKDEIEEMSNLVLKLKDDKRQLRYN